jgi:GNAT superfamily N-acetyltransferase
MNGSRRHKSASLRLSVPQCLPDEMHEGVREITSLEATEQRQGHATELLQSVCREADHKRKVLFVQPAAYAVGMDDAALVAFYERHGFGKLQDEPVLMSRPIQVAH